MSNLKMTAELKEAFVAMLEEIPNITVVRKAFGVSSSTVYDTKAKDPEWAKALEAAVHDGYDLMEEAARQRAVDGWVEPQFYQGEQVYGDDGKPVGIRKFSDSLLKFLLTHCKPKKFNPGAKLQVGDGEKVKFVFKIGGDDE